MYAYRDVFIPVPKVICACAESCTDRTVLCVPSCVCTLTWLTHVLRVMCFEAGLLELMYGTPQVFLSNSI